MPDDADWDDWRVFLAVARGGGLQRAAEHLRLDPSTVSRRIARLEAAKGARLFERAGRSLALNETGAALMTYAEEMEALVYQAQGALSDLDPRIEGTVRLGAPEGLGSGFLAGALGAATAEFPGLEIELVALPQSYSLASREVDIAITLEPPATGRVATARLTDYLLALYASPAWLAAHGPVTALADLRGRPLAGYIDALIFTDELRYLKFGPVTLSPTLRSTSVIAQGEMVRAGAAAGILPRFIAERCGGLVRLLPEAVALRRTYWISVHDDLRRIRRIRAIIDWVTARVRTERRLFLGEGGTA